MGRAGCQKGAGGCEGDPVGAATAELIELIKRRRSDLFASDRFFYGGGRGQRTAAMHGKLALYHPSIRRYPDCSVLTGHHLDHNLFDLDPNLFSG